MKKILLFAFFASACSMFSQKLPYPIIFIHGLNSQSDVWTDQGLFFATKGLSFGGRIDYCLNYDSNNTTTNKNTYPTPNADIALFTDYNALSIGDYYFLNFNIDNLGRLPSNSSFTDVLSNESAITKQGVALKYAIQMVLLKTGKEKVILVGHSMGGLCAREYLQNPINWQSDSQHHVAKLITTGTPHGGYTGTNFSMLTGIDSSGEAYRDLRKEYSNGNVGVYLYGGIENSTTLGTDFYNNDINTNSINNDNTLVLGINQKSLFSDVDYAYIVGECTNCFISQGTIPGDGIVRSVNANLNNFYTLPIPVNEFIYTAVANNGFELHSDLPHAVVPNMQGLDEPNEYNLSYGIYANTIYTGFITQQPAAGYLYDFDDYKFTVNATGLVNISINNTYSGNLTCRIMNSSFAQVATTTLTGNSSGGLSQALNPGQYYLEFFSTASSTSYNFPYNFSVTSTLETNDIAQVNDIIYPNPASSKVFVKSENTFDKIEVYNLFGQKVISTNEYINGINVSDLPTGNYIIKLYNQENVITQKLIIQ